ncbi:MAG TPA: hypothetical protein VMV49_10885 [Candidatus Deferrimicrobium sp.]|nr:hypothetical protein [Candidatus Deferrimicrobium sp.]
MTKEKCILKIAMASKLCDDLISKELLILSSLIGETGLRVSDIHATLGGNKSWVSNLCSRLAIAGLASSTKDGREVYYNLTEAGTYVAERAYRLIEGLVRAEKIPYIVYDNTYILYKFLESENNLIINKLLFPLYTHKGALLLHQTENFLLFIGKDQKGRILVLEIPIANSIHIELGFDEFYKRRLRPRPKPLILDYTHELEKISSRIYLFIDFHSMGRINRNSEFVTILKETIKFQDNREKSPSLESNNDIISTVE